MVGVGIINGETNMPDFDLESLHPNVRWYIGRSPDYPIHPRRLARASREQYALSESDARLNQMSYRMATGREPEPGYGYPSPAYMTPQVRKDVQQQWTNLAKMDIQPGVAPNVGRNDDKYTTYRTPSGGFVVLPTTKDPKIQAQRARMFGAGFDATTLPANHSLPVDTAKQVGFSGTPASIGQKSIAQQTPYERSYLAGYTGYGGVTLPESPTLGYRVGQAIGSGSFFGAARKMLGAASPLGLWY